jgi:hypothetical protein
MGRCHICADRNSGHPAPVIVVISAHGYPYLPVARAEEPTIWRVIRHSRSVAERTTLPLTATDLGRSTGQLAVR